MHKDDARAEDLIDRLDKAIDENKWLVVAGHGIRTGLGRKEEAARDFEEKGKRWDGYKPVEFPVLEAFCRTVDERRGVVFVGTFGDIGRYVKERNGAEIEIVKDSAKKIVLKITHPLDPKAFDYPLTLKLSLAQPVFLEGVFQDDKRLTVITRRNEILFDVVPDRGEVTIKLN